MFHDAEGPPDGGKSCAPAEAANTQKNGKWSVERKWVWKMESTLWMDHRKGRDNGKEKWAESGLENGGKMHGVEMEIIV